MSVDPTIGQPGWGAVLNARLDALAAFGTALTQGLLANRPAANTGARIYFATDDNGGTLYRSDGVSTWTQLAAGVSIAKGSIVTASNASGTTTSTGAVINTLVDIPSTGITVPANTPGDVWLEYAADFIDIGTTGKGVLALVETTSGAVLRSSVVAAVISDSSVGSFPQKSFQIGAVTTARTFKLQIEFITTNATFATVNTATNPSYLTVVSR